MRATSAGSFRAGFRIMRLLVVGVLIAASCSSDDAIDAGDGGADIGGDDSGDAAGGGTMPSIAGSWILSVLEIDGGTVPLPVDDGGQTRAPEMTIEQGQIAGSGGCNQFGGAISIDGEALSISDLAITEMACMPQDIMTFETAYVTALNAVTGWAADPSGITFTGDQVRIEYHPASPVEHAELEETLWELDSIFSGEGIERAVSSTDMSAPPAKLVISAQVATLSAEDCSSITLDVVYEPGREGNFRVEGGAIGPNCDNVNMEAALTGISDATGYMVFENRLTFIGLPGETVGFVDRS